MYNTMQLWFMCSGQVQWTSWWSLMQNKTRTQEISALGHFLIQNSSGPVNETCFYAYNHAYAKFVTFSAHFGSLLIFSTIFAIFVMYSMDPMS